MKARNAAQRSDGMVGRVRSGHCATFPAFNKLFSNTYDETDSVKEYAEVASDKVNDLLERVKESKPNIDGALEGTSFSKREKELIRKVLEAVYNLYDGSTDRDMLNNSVLRKLKRDHKG